MCVCVAGLCFECSLCSVVVEWVVEANSAGGKGNGLAEGVSAGGAGFLVQLVGDVCACACAPVRVRLCVCGKEVGGSGGSQGSRES